MSIKEKFINIWKSHYNVLTVSFNSLIMVVVEEIMEVEFKCPQKESLKKLYVISYFFCPAFITFFMSLTSHPDCIPLARCMRKRSCYWKTDIILKAFLPPLIWCMILLCDGRYIDCVASRSVGNNSQNANKIGAADLPSEFYTLSQVAGLFTITAVVSLYSLYRVYPFWFCCNYEEGQREQVKNLLEEEAWKHFEELKKEGIEQIMEERVKPSLQLVVTNFWKNLDLGNAAKKIKEAVESAVRDRELVSEQAVEQGVPFTSRTGTTTGQPMEPMNTSF